MGPVQDNQMIHPLYGIDSFCIIEIRNVVVVVFMPGLKIEWHLV